jgi:hypothetical protein
LTNDHLRSNAVKYPVHAPRALLRLGKRFQLVYQEVSAVSFVAERDGALDPATGTRLIPDIRATRRAFHFARRRR